MAELFRQGTWIDGKSQFPGRRKLEYSNSSVKFVNIERDEGQIIQEGDKFNAASMEDLERRISLAFEELSKKVGSVKNQLDLYYPVGKLFISVVDLKLETKEGAEAQFPGAKSEWIRLPQDGQARIMLPSTSAGITGGKASNICKPTASTTINTSTFVHNTSLRADQIPNHTHGAIVDVWYANDDYPSTWTRYAKRYKGEPYDDIAYYCDDIGWTIYTHSIESAGTGGSHGHGCDKSASYTPNDITIKTEQKCIKVYVWQRTK